MLDADKYITYVCAKFNVTNSSYKPLLTRFRPNWFIICSAYWPIHLTHMDIYIW